MVDDELLFLRATSATSQQSPKIYRNVFALQKLAKIVLCFVCGHSVGSQSEVAIEDAARLSDVAGLFFAWTVNAGRASKRRRPRLSVIFSFPFASSGGTQKDEEKLANARLQLLMRKGGGGHFSSDPRFLGCAEGLTGNAGY